MGAAVRGKYRDYRLQLPQAVAWHDTFQQSCNSHCCHLECVGVECSRGDSPRTQSLQNGFPIEAARN